MREVEARLTSEPRAIVQLAADVFGEPEPTRAQVESVRRAAKQLASLGRAELQRRDCNFHHGTQVTLAYVQEFYQDPRPLPQPVPVHKSLLTARTPKTAEELEEDARRLERVLARMAELGLGKAKC